MSPGDDDALGEAAERVAAFAREAEARCGHGDLCLREGDWAGARVHYLEAVAMNPDSARAFLGLGLAVRACDETERASVYLKRAIDLAPQSENLPNLVFSALAGASPPSSWPVMMEIGDTLVRHKRSVEALPFFEYAARSAPNEERPWLRYAQVLRFRRLHREAADCMQRALEINPDSSEAHALLAAALADDMRYDESTEHYRKAAELDPLSAGASTALGYELIRAGKLDEAEDLARLALASCADGALLMGVLGSVADTRGEMELSERYAERVVQLSPGLHSARFDLAAKLLRRGEYGRGWELFESRLITSENRRAFVQPQWDGSPLNGRRILVYGEQGTGDLVQFLRYLPLVKGRGGTVLLECIREQKPLVECAAGWDIIVERRADFGPPDVPFDVQVAIMSLPYAFRTTLESIPGPVPYLVVSRSRRDTWQRRLAEVKGTLKVGICWTGNPRLFGNRYRSCPQQAYGRLTEIPGVRLFSLQAGSGAEQFSDLLDRMGVVNLAPHLTDFAETAAAIDSLDLVISVDSSPAHIAGALGRPVWTLIARPNDWRWLLDRSDSPWYPTMRLFRQPRPEDWDSVFDAVSEALRARIAALDNSDAQAT